MKTKFFLVLGLFCLTPFLARAVFNYAWQPTSSSLFSCTFEVDDFKVADGEILRDEITDNPVVVTPDANVVIVFRFNSFRLFVDAQGNIVSGSFTVSDFNNIGGNSTVYGSATNLTENSYVGGQLVATYTEDGQWITRHTADGVPDAGATLWPMLLVSGILVAGQARFGRQRN